MASNAKLQLEKAGCLLKESAIYDTPGLFFSH